MEQRCYGCMKLRHQPGRCEHCGRLDTDQNELHQLPVGTVLQNHYVVGKVLGQGGFGITYLGWDQHLEEPVAIKEYFPSGQVSRSAGVSQMVNCTSGAMQFQEGRERFLREARTLAKLRKVSNIVQVMSFFAENNTAYIVMEYVEGITLLEYIRRRGGKLSASETFNILQPVIRALHQVHQAGMIHRDISPDNIMLQQDGTVKLLDFGTARDVDVSSGGQLAHSTQAVLKYGFAPAEQYTTGRAIDLRADEYALCSTVYYCLTGKLPPDAFQRLMDGLPMDWRQIPGLTPNQIWALEKGSAVRAEDRFANLEELDRALFGTGGGFPGTAPVNFGTTGGNIPGTAPVNYGPSGNGPAGFGPSGNGPAGYGPSGNGPAGFGPSGNGPAGFGPSGNGPAGYGPSGNGPAGFGPSGNGPAGFGPSGNGPAGYGPSGNGPAGFGPSGNGPAGFTGNGPTGFTGNGPVGFTGNQNQGPGFMDRVMTQAKELADKAMVWVNGMLDKLEALPDNRKWLVPGAAGAVALVALILSISILAGGDEPAAPAPAPDTLVATTEAPKPSGDWRKNILISDVVKFDKDGNYPVLGNDLYKRSQIRTVTFMDTTTSANGSAWDVSQAGDYSIVAWVEDAPGGYDLYIGAEGGVRAPANCEKLFYKYENVTQIKFNGNFHVTGDVTSTQYMFSGCKLLKTLDVSEFDTSGVTDMSYMFEYCEQVTTLDVKNFDTARVTDMEHMFYNCLELTKLDVRSFDTSRVTNMRSMFFWCKNVPLLDLSGFDTTNVKKMNWMLRGCKSAVIDLGNWEVDSIASADNYDNFMDDGAMYNGKAWEKIFSKVK